MPVNPHLATELEFFGAPLPAAELVVLLLHGRTQSPADMDEQVVRRLALPAVAYAAPVAAGRTWYPLPFMAPVADNQPGLSFALERVALLSDRLAASGFPETAQVVMGFSQGGCLACEFVFRSRRRFAALVAFTGGLIGPAGTRWDGETGAFRDMPVFVGGSDRDPWVPAARMAESAEVFRREKAAVTERYEPSTKHEIPDGHIAEVRSLLLELQRTPLRAATPRG
jgi:predicted esterase